jgi:hypothetical protein
MCSTLPLGRVDPYLSSFLLTAFRFWRLSPFLSHLPFECTTPLLFPVHGCLRPFSVLKQWGTMPCAQFRVSSTRFRVDPQGISVAWRLSVPVCKVSQVDREAFELCCCHFKQITECCYTLNFLISEVNNNWPRGVTEQCTKSLAHIKFKKCSLLSQLSFPDSIQLLRSPKEWSPCITVLIQK